MKTTFILLMYLLTFTLFGQGTQFSDSLNFYLRTKTKEIHTSQKSNGKVFRTASGYFNKDTYSLVWCDKHAALPYSCSDTIYFERTSDLQIDSTARYFWDNKGRHIKTVQQERPGQISTTEYFYTDSLSKRLKFILRELPNESTLIYLYSYENNALKSLYESFYGSSLGNGKFESHRTYTYTYYPDSRVKTETVETNGKVEYISEFRYVESE